MSVKTRTIVPTVVVIALGLLAFQVMRGPGSPADNKGDDRNVGLYGVWEPSPFKDGVKVTITINGRTQLEKTETVAPITRTYPASRGDQVTIQLFFKPGKFNQNLIGTLGCSITSNGTEVVYDWNRKAKIKDVLQCRAVLT